MGESFTIQLSSNLVKQLADDGEKLKKKTRKPKKKIRREPIQSRTEVYQNQIFDDSDALKNPNDAGWPLQTTLFLPVTPHPQYAHQEIDAIRSILQDSEKVLEKLQKQEEEMEREVTQRAKDIHEKEFKLPYQKPMPCLAEKDDCLECYRENLKNPVKCSNLVKKFADCVQTARQQVSSVDE